MWAIIGGTGFENLPEVAEIEQLDGDTPYGACSSGLKRIQVSQQEFIFLPRHGQHHEWSPSDINYRANIYALRHHGATKIASISAVGSLQEDIHPGDVVIPAQYIDRSKATRKQTFCGEGMVGHASLADPTCLALGGKLAAMQKQFDFNLHFAKTYISMEGPAFSTRAESNFYRMIGGHVIGMSNFPECALAREAGMCYLPLSFVTDYDSGVGGHEHVTIDVVKRIMRENLSKAFEIVKNFLPSVAKFECDSCITQSLRDNLLTPPERLNQQQKALIELISKT